LFLAIKLGGGPTGHPSRTRVLCPIIIFICSLFAILYYLGVMQVAGERMAVVMQRVMGASGAEATNVAAASSWTTEAPITIRRFWRPQPIRAFTIMVSGMAHVSALRMAPMF